MHDQVLKILILEPILWMLLLAFFMSPANSGIMVITRLAGAATCITTSCIHSASIVSYAYVVKQKSSKYKWFDKECFFQKRRKWGSLRENIIIHYYIMSDKCRYLNARRNYKQLIKVKKKSYFPIVSDNMYPSLGMYYEDVLQGMNRTGSSRFCNIMY